MTYSHVKVPEGGARIGIQDGKLQVPDNPIIPFVEGDGTGRDIWRASVRVLDAAVERAYGGERKIRHLPVLEGENLLGIVGIREVVRALVEQLWRTHDPEARERARELLDRESAPVSSEPPGA